MLSSPSFLLSLLKAATVDFPNHPRKHPQASIISFIRRLRRSRIIYFLLLNNRLYLSDIRLITNISRTKRASSRYESYFKIQY